MMYKSQFNKIDPCDWFHGPGSHLWAWLSSLYLLYSVMSLMRSSEETLLLSCLKSGEKRLSLSTVPWLSLNTDLEYTDGRHVWLNLNTLLIVRELFFWAFVLAKLKQQRCGYLTLQTRQKACGTFQVCYRIAYWISTSFGQSGTRREIGFQCIWGSKINLHLLHILHLCI